MELMGHGIPLEVLLLMNYINVTLSPGQCCSTNVSLAAACNENVLTPQIIFFSGGTVVAG